MQFRLEKKDFFMISQKKKKKVLNFNILLICISGASKEIGTALTRVCLRHRAVETRMKSFATAIMDCLIMPLQVRQYTMQYSFLSFLSISYSLFLFVYSISG